MFHNSHQDFSARRRTKSAIGSNLKSVGKLSGERDREKERLALWVRSNEAETVS